MGIEVHTMATITIQCDECHEEETLNVPINKVDDWEFIKQELYDAGRWGWSMQKGKIFCSSYCEEESKHE